MAQWLSIRLRSMRPRVRIPTDPAVAKKIESNNQAISGSGCSLRLSGVLANGQNACRQDKPYYGESVPPDFECAQVELNCPIAPYIEHEQLIANAKMCEKLFIIGLLMYVYSILDPWH